MELVVKECSLLDWKEQARAISSAAVAKEIQIDQNLFCSIQFLPDEQFKIERKAFQANIDNEPVGWLMVYFLSDEVIRLRGLYVKSEFRRKGVMTRLIDEVLKLYKGRARRCVSFALDQHESRSFHTKSGFSCVENFIPRPVEHYDDVAKKYYVVEEDRLVLFERSLV